MLTTVGVALLDPAALLGGVDEGMTGAVIGTAVFTVIAGLMGGLFGALLGSLTGSILGLVFFAPTLPSLRPLVSGLLSIAGRRRELRPVDRVRWSWRHARYGFAGAIQFGVLGGILGGILLGSLGALSGVLESFLVDEMSTVLGPVSIKSAGKVARAAFACELMLGRGSAVY